MFTLSTLARCKVRSTTFGVRLPLAFGQFHLQSSPVVVDSNKSLRRSYVYRAIALPLHQRLPLVTNVARSRCSVTSISHYCRCVDTGCAQQLAVARLYVKLYLRLCFDAVLLLNRPLDLLKLKKRSSTENSCTTC
jgi:hypothetical protein